MARTSKKPAATKKATKIGGKLTAKDMEKSLTGLLQRVDKVRGTDPRRTQAREVVFSLTGAVPGTFVVKFGKAGSQSEISRQRSAVMPTLELIGDADKIHSVIEGRLNARKAFLSGGIRIRGDLALFEQVARELDIL